MSENGVVVGYRRQNTFERMKLFSCRKRAVINQVTGQLVYMRSDGWIPL